MDPIWDAVAKLLLRFTDPVQIVLLLACIAEGVFIYWFIKILRAEDRTDRQAQIDAIKGMTDALLALRITVAAMTGKAP